MVLGSKLRAALLLSLLAVACSSDDTQNAKTCPARAAFELSLSSALGPLPADTLLRVQYGGGVEEFRLSDSSHQQEAVLCDEDFVDGAASDSGAPVTALHCALWTQGAATVTVTTGAFPTVVKELQAQADGKCIVTVPVDVVLGDQDATP